MKNKIGFNLIFAIIAFPIGLGILREFDMQTFTFKNKYLAALYIITFSVSIYFMLKKKSDSND